MSQWSLCLAHKILGIEPPSECIGHMWNKIVADGAPWPPAPSSWYSARDSRNAYESPELRDAARRVRRLIRRHWFALLFEPDSPIALSVRDAMLYPPEETDRVNIHQQMRDLLGAGKIKIDPDVARDFAEQCGVRFEKDDGDEP